MYLGHNILMHASKHQIIISKIAQHPEEPLTLVSRLVPQMTLRCQSLARPSHPRKGTGLLIYMLPYLLEA